jgi:Pentapeptide repeats (8 copies)
MREFSLMETFAIVAAGLLAIVAAGLVIWLVPRWQVHRWRRAGISGEEKLAELGLQARTSITQALGGLALIVTIAITANQALKANRSATENLKLAGENLDLAERGQVSERFLGAVEQLGATNGSRAAVDVRTGALFSLRSVGLESKPNADPVFRAVAAYVVNNYKVPKLENDGCDAPFNRRSADVKVALRFVLPDVARKWLKGRLLEGLRGTDLRGLAIDDLYLSRYDLTNVKLRRASLNGADFRNSNLFGANFVRACLNRADFQDAYLHKAHFDGASLKGANFKGANARCDVQACKIHPGRPRPGTAVGGAEA